MARIIRFFVLFWIFHKIRSKTLIQFEECDQFLARNDCYYFPCLDAHFSCGPDNHLVRFSYELCVLSTKTYSSNLTQNAQEYFNKTNQCAMEYLSNSLLHDHISEAFTCTNLQALIKNIYVNCYQSYQLGNNTDVATDFCEIVCDNLQTMIHLFLNLLNPVLNLHEFLTEAGQTCGAHIVDTRHTIPSLLISICLDRKNAKLTHDITDIMIKPRFESNDYDWV